MAPANPDHRPGEPRAVGEVIGLLTQRNTEMNNDPEGFRKSHEREIKDAIRSFDNSIGERYRSCCKKNYIISHDKQRVVMEAISEYAGNIDQNIDAGRGVVLYGPSGTGKDHMLITLGRYAAVRLIRAGAYRNKVSVISGAELCAKFRGAIGDDNEEKVMKDFVRPGVLILQDPVPSTGSPSDFQLQQLYRLIDARYRDLKPTWASINASCGADAEAVLGTPIVDRLSDGALTLHCDWPSYRRKTR